jgi:hypothetical protein
VDERAVRDLRDLAGQDASLTREAARLRELDEEVAALRERAEAIDAFFSAYPDEETRRRAALAAAEEELARRRDELRTAEAELERAREPETRDHAAHAVERGLDHVSVAEAALRRARSDADELERDAASLPEEVPLLEARARAIADEAPDVPQPPGGPRLLVQWASQAHAELFVAAGHIDGQREQVVREGNELASMLLGEPTYGSTVAQALGRVITTRGTG